MGSIGSIKHDVPVIIRMWETPVKPGQTDALVKYVMAEVWPGVTGAKGFMGGEILRSYNGGEERLPSCLARWQDAAAASPTSSGRRGKPIR